MHNPAPACKQWFEESIKNEKLVAQIKKLKLIILDVDGALTDGNCEYGDGYEGKTRWFSTQDGYGVRRLITTGINVAIITGKSSGAVTHRAKNFGIPDDLCFMNSNNKDEVAEQIQKKLGISPEETLVFGDDFIDAKIKVANPTTFFITPSNAPFYIQHTANTTVPLRGGQHAFRLVLDLVLYVQEKHFAQDLINNALHG